MTYWAFSDAWPVRVPVADLPNDGNWQPSFPRSCKENMHDSSLDGLTSWKLRWQYHTDLVPSPQPRTHTLSRTTAHTQAIR